MSHKRERKSKWDWSSDIIMYLFLIVMIIILFLSFYQLYAYLILDLELSYKTNNFNYTIKTITIIILIIFIIFLPKYRKSKKLYIKSWPNLYIEIAIVFFSINYILKNICEIFIILDFITLDLLILLTQTISSILFLIGIIYDIKNLK